MNEQTVSATEARVRFGELLRRVKEDDAVYVVERNGEGQAVIISVEEHKRLLGGQQRTPTWRQALERWERYLEQHPEERDALLQIDAVELIRQGREERSAEQDRVLFGREPHSETYTEPE